jgi:hypothetical protein
MDQGTMTAARTRAPAHDPDGGRPVDLRRPGRHVQRLTQVKIRLFTRVRGRHNLWIDYEGEYGIDAVEDAAAITGTSGDDAWCRFPRRE